MASSAFYWFRRDLRLEDNHGLFKALRDEVSVLCVFVFDRQILDELPADDPRVSFIHQEVARLKCELVSRGSDLVVRYGKPVEVWQELVTQYAITKLYANRDYEPYAKERDAAIADLFARNGGSMSTFKDHVIYEGGEILKKDGGVYTVFTPYKRTWLQHFTSDYCEFLHAPDAPSRYPSEHHLDHVLPVSHVEELISLEAMGFRKSDMIFPSRNTSQKVIRNYATQRDFPWIEEGTSRLGIHFRFGTISVRKKAIRAYQLSEVYLSELIWRDFYAQILDQFPHVVGHAYKPAYDRIAWRIDSAALQHWQEGTTGYPLVDAGMRELNSTGHMHNRVRMVVASFLTKHLLIDWRLGEAYFASKLLDFDLASNNGGWQWAAGTGTDAAPYFRIFNPESQMKKFDPRMVYVRKWVSEYGTARYPLPIVDHKMARDRCLQAYKKALSSE